MTYDEIEVEARLLELIELSSSFDEVNDDELIELIDDVKEVTDGDYEEAYEYIIQYAPLDKQRFCSLCM